MDLKGSDHKSYSAACAITQNEALMTILTRLEQWKEQRIFSPDPSPSSPPSPAADPSQRAADAARNTENYNLFLSEFF